MISGLSSVTGLRSQEPYRASTAKPDEARKASSAGTDRKRRLRPVRAQRAPGSVARRLGEGDDVVDHGLDAVRHPQHPPGRVRDGGGVRRVPGLPRPRGRVPRLEGEAPAVHQRRPDRHQRRPHLVVVDQALERVADHGGQLELPVPAASAALPSTQVTSVRRRARSSIATSGSSPRGDPGVRGPARGAASRRSRSPRRGPSRPPSPGRCRRRRRRSAHRPTGSSRRRAPPPRRRSTPPQASDWAPSGARGFSAGPEVAEQRRHRGWRRARPPAARPAAPGP